MAPTTRTARLQQLSDRSRRTASTPPAPGSPKRLDSPKREKGTGRRVRGPKPPKVEDPHQELEKNIGLHWEPSFRRASDSSVSTASSRSASSTSSSGSRKISVRERKVPADTLEAWFDTGLDTSKKYVAGVVPLPGEYSGVNSKSALIRQEECGLTIWPVRLDIGNIDESLHSQEYGQSKPPPPRTLYYYTHRPAFNKFLDICAKKQDVASNVLELLERDYLSRTRFDGLYLQEGCALCSVEPAAFASRLEVFFDVLGVHVPVGGISYKRDEESERQHIDLNDCCDFVIPIQVPDMACEDLAISGRHIVKINVHVLETQLQMSKHVKRATNVLSRSLFAARNDLDSVSERKNRCCSCIRLPGFNRSSRPTMKANHLDILVKKAFDTNLCISGTRADGTKKKMHELEWERKTAEHLIQLKKQEEERQFIAKQKDELTKRNATQRTKRGKIVLEGEIEPKNESKKRVQVELETRVSEWREKAQFFNIFYLAGGLQSTGVAQKAEVTVKGRQ